jgi:DNA-binding response OmpR family regulator
MVATIWAGISRVASGPTLRLVSDDFDAVILDLMLPDADGLISARIRAKSGIPLLMRRAAIRSTA